MDLNSNNRKGVRNKPSKRVGRGPGSGHGKTAGRGSKGHQSRSGWSRRRTFEGGQVPLFRKVPVKGFGHNGEFNIDYMPVNLSQLASYKSGETVDLDSLVSKGVIHASNQVLVKLLGGGEIKVKLNIRVHAASKSALEKVKAAGGSVEIIGR
ncbi:MAG: 50S ribosomal protein L15 [Planctomycetota bacterium]